MEAFAKTFKCPDMVSQEDAMIVQQTLVNVPGIDRVEPDHRDHTVFVSCAAAEDLRDIQGRLSEAGYPAEE